MRTSYATDATAVGNEPPLNKYGNAAPYGNVGQTGGVVGSGGNGYGYETTTTTHVPHGGYKPYSAPPASTGNGTF